MSKWMRTLYVQVIIAIILGCLVGYFFPGFSSNAKLISNMFINLIKMLIAPITFVTVVLGIAGVGNIKKVGRVGGIAIFYFEVVSTIALLIGLFVANWIQPGKGVQADALKTEQEEYQRRVVLGTFEQD